jgi:hypothetical protein
MSASSAPPNVDGEIARPSAPPAPSTAPSGTATPDTLDEPVLTTILRDVRMVARKLRVVLLPLGAMRGRSGGAAPAGDGAGATAGSASDAAAAADGVVSALRELREWDLWGPLVLCLALSIILSLSAPAGQSALVFASVFATVWAGAGGEFFFFFSAAACCRARRLCTCTRAYALLTLCCRARALFLSLSPPAQS